LSEDKKKKKRRIKIIYLPNFVAKSTYDSGMALMYRSGQLCGFCAGWAFCCTLLLSEHHQTGQEDVLGYTEWTSTDQVKG